MTAKKSTSSERPRLGDNGVDVIVGTQSLVDGLVYDAEGNVIERTGDPDKRVIDSSQIGVFRREVYEDGSVATFQTEPLKPSAEIDTPVPLPGEKQDQTGAGLSDAEVSTSK